MSITKLDDGRYMVDIRPAGRNGKRTRRKFDRKAEAVAFERYTLVNASQNPASANRADRRLLSQLLDTWWVYHGRDHELGKIYKRHLVKTINGIGDCPISRLDKINIIAYRSARLEAGICAATINREIYRFSGMLEKLRDLGEFSAANPIRGIKPLIEVIPEMTFLHDYEIRHLLEALTDDARLVALICLSTGGRWTEVATLKPSQIINGRVTYLKTKSRKKRVVPISAELEVEIKTKASGRLFNVDYLEFRSILKQVKPDLPFGQATHVLRHTFASHFIMNGGSIVALRDILGHAKIEQTMAYAHLAPDFLQNAVALNPLGGGVSMPAG